MVKNQDDYENEYEPQDEGGDDYDEESQEHEPRDEGGHDYGEDYQDQDQSQDGEGDETDNSPCSSNNSTDDDGKPANTEAGKEENSTYNTHESWWMDH